MKLLFSCIESSLITSLPVVATQLSFSFAQPVRNNINENKPNEILLF